MTVYIWSKNKNGWLDTNPIQGDHCDTYGTCGNNNLCNAINLPPCECLDGFQPTSPLEWESLQWSSGCVRRKPLNCSEPQGFKKFSDIKLPDNSRILGNRTAMSLADCEKACLGNCSCSAYAWAEVVGCAVWYGPSKTGRQRLALIASSVSIIIGLVFLAITTWYGFHAMVARRKRRVIGNEESLELLGDSLELQIIGFDELVAATNNFSDDNKLGAGGFGPVYKGILTDGQEIAVKRLYSFSGQGIEEFKNEILLISKLQHRNLVRLLGCSIHGEEKLLVYEHMKNKSLDIILFGPNPPAPSLLSSLKLLVAATSSSKAIIGSSDESLSSTQSSSLEAVYRLDNQSFATQSRYPQSHSSPPGYRCPGAAGQDYS
nr:G-type lectin S-receptor-like serine/threonine-protein kinase At4g27290 [Ipomoea batatas]